MDAIDEAGLLGRGGAAFPTAAKWRAVAGQPARPHYLVCNADESEPGTFKDRVLMEEQPGAVVEAMAIAMLATGCEKGYVYIRAEYPLAHERMAGGDRGKRAARHRAPHRRRRVRLRRGDGALPVDRGLPRRAAQQAAVPRRGRPVRQADRRQQRRDARQRPAHPPRRRASDAAVLPLGQRRAAGPVRARARDAARASCSTTPAPSRRKAVLLGGAAGHVPRPGRARHRARLQRHARLGRRHGLRRERRPARRDPLDRRVLPRGVVRPVRPVPHRHRPPGRGARIACRTATDAGARASSRR